MDLLEHSMPAPRKGLPSDMPAQNQRSKCCLKSRALFEVLGSRDCRLKVSRWHTAPAATSNQVEPIGYQVSSPGVKVLHVETFLATGSPCLPTSLPVDKHCLVQSFFAMIKLLCSFHPRHLLWLSLIACSMRGASQVRSGQVRPVRQRRARFRVQAQK